MVPRPNFQEKWLSDDHFKEWLGRVPGYSAKAYCNVCHKQLSAEITSLKRHRLSKQHVTLMARRARFVRGKSSDGVTSRTKVETWQTITQQINGAFPCVSRTVEQVQKRYHNITSSGKHRIATHKRLFCKRGGGPSGDKPQLNPLSDAVADEDEDTTRTCTFMIPPPQSSQESQPSGSTLIHRSTSVDWGQPITKKVIDLKITELQNSIKFYSAQMEVARAQMEAARAQMELQKTKIELAKVQLQKYHEMREEST